MTTTLEKPTVIDPSTVEVGGKLGYAQFTSDPTRTPELGDTVRLRDGYIAAELMEPAARFIATIGRPEPMAHLIESAGIDASKVVMEVVKGDYETIKDFGEGLIESPEYWVANQDDTIGFGERDEYTQSDLVFTRLA